METLLGVGVGLGLAAACGFRIFAPLLVASLAARSGHLQMAEGFEWVASSAALTAFAVATVLEVAAYYIPWVDNLLDSLASPAAVVAGILVSASTLAELDAFLRWTLAVVAGGGLAGGVQALTAGTRQASLVTTGGLANPLVSTAEAAGAVAVAVLAVAVPAAVMIGIFGLLVLLTGRFLRPRAAAH